jgi:hypothetical protein
VHANGESPTPYIIDTSHIPPKKQNKKCSHYISFGISNDPALFLSFISLKKKSSRADRLVLLFYLERENGVEMKYSKQTKDI